MYAIVLTYDRSHPIADHMMETYRQFWPQHPFVFRIPYQEHPVALKKKYGSMVDLVQAPSDIRATVLALLRGLADHEWVYWCIDDKFLLRLDKPAAEACHAWVTAVRDDRIQGALFCRCRRLLKEENLRSDLSRTDAHGRVYLARRNYHQFWIHQFMRVSVLRDLFHEFPDRPFRAKEMDEFTGQNAGLQVKEFGARQEMYVSERNFAVFAESTHRGMLTRRCRDSMVRHGIAVPAGLMVTDKDFVMGEL